MERYARGAGGYSGGKRRGGGTGSGRGGDQHDYHGQSPRANPSSNSTVGGTEVTTNGSPVKKWSELVISGQGGNSGGAAGLTFGSFNQLTISEPGEGLSGVGFGRGAWGRGRGISNVPVQSERSQPGGRSCKITEQVPSESSEGNDKILRVKRPDNGGCQLATRGVKLLANHFPVSFNIDHVIQHYHVEIKPDGWPGKIKKPYLSMIRETYFNDQNLPLEMTAYDGEKNIFSAVQLPTGTFNVDFSASEDGRPRPYMITIQLVSELKLSKLKDYLMGNVLSVPRDILQGMDLVMKQNPFRKMISVGRSFYQIDPQTDLGYGIVAAKGFQHSLKPTSQALSLCLDHSVMSFRRRMPVIEFLEDHVENFSVENFATERREEVENALRNLKVTVTHRRTKLKYTIAGLTRENARDISFEVKDEEGHGEIVTLVDYYREKYGKEIKFKNIPCLEVGTKDKPNKVPMEFCKLVVGQRYRKEDLDKEAAKTLKTLSLPPPFVRRGSICDMVQSDDGPCGGSFLQNFDLQVELNMTAVEGRVIPPPTLKLGREDVITVDREKCQWNLDDKYLVDGKTVERWAIIDFTPHEKYNKLNPEKFIPGFIDRCLKLGIKIKNDPYYESTRMIELNNVNKLQQRIEGIKKRFRGQLQILLCVMSRMDDGYKTLKWLCETKLGVVTQCCLSFQANKVNNQYLSNLALKLNAKLGGSNAELNVKLPRFENESHVMFVGGDVNHPKAHDISSPSIAAVVATVNWPGANRYAARVQPQAHREERILKFGDMCVDLICTYARMNKARPQRIVVFRDGVSEGQFDMVLNEELVDLRRAIREKMNYNPTITLVVAQKRHQTRLFPENRDSGSSNGNVFPGTVVDQKIVNPSGFDFYLCSHHGSIGTSKPTHYQVLLDEHGFTSDQLQKLIYDLCFTFARCTKPVSLVPPVYYADLVAYRGRMYYETLPPGASVVESFYRLHDELKDSMFFI